MANPTATSVAGFLRGLAQNGHLRDASDFDLLQRFASQRDEAAFQAIVRRHGAMVLSVCRAAAKSEQDAEDAFQATFLVLARRAQAIRKAQSLGSWLFGVAHRAGLRARTISLKSKMREARVAKGEASTAPEATAAESLSWAEAQSVIHQELNCLGERHRGPLVLCYLEGLTQDDAAHSLGWSKSTFKRRLDQARDLLRRRLVRRGLGPAAVLATAVVPLVRPTVALAATTVKAALETAAAQTVTTSIVSVQVANLTRSIMHAYFLTKLKMVAATVLLAVGGLGVGYSAILATAPGEPRQNADALLQQGEKTPDAAKAGKEAAKPAAAQKEEEIQRPPIISEAGAESENNLKQILLALHNYHDRHGGFPPAAINNKDGKPLLSWRVAILPYIEHDNLFKQFKLDEPWDSEHNKKLVMRMPRNYSVPAIPTKNPGETFYQVFVGKGTPFEPVNNEGANIHIKQITDGTANTFMVVEAAKPVIWTKPEDLPFELKGALPKLGVFADGFHAAMCDGSVNTIRRKLDAGTLRALITRNGGEILPADVFKE
ncbi:MAG: sigma-70 family RNA polymerase sigma factor [Planctomycetes bacterium]|nr:sigma-70 family RNA polymerase sigma factor [Planctomycetota bacterium]